MTKSLDRYRESAVEKTTMRITRALAKLRADLPIYRRKPTKKDLARLAGVHVNTLDLRSKNHTQGCGAGWPLSILADLQKEWKDSAQSGGVRPNTPAKGPIFESDESFSLEAYKMQNIALLYRNEELTQENVGLNRVNDNLRRELELISDENSKLKAAHLAMKRGQARLKSIK